MQIINFSEIGRLPMPNDNCAIAVKTLARETAVRYQDTQFTLNHTILEGHRFAIQPIRKGEPLLSWGMPFGKALRDIMPGEYVCNQKLLTELNGRSLDFTLPSEPNFADAWHTYQLDPARFQATPPLPLKVNEETFMGYQRPGDRGVGTRNTIVLLGVNALVAGFVQQLEKEAKHLLENTDQIDNIVAVTHTEGSQLGNNNQDHLLRTLAGYMVHPNVGAVLAIDSADVGVSNKQLKTFLAENAYPIQHVPHHFISLENRFSDDLAIALTKIKEWLPLVNEMQRTPQPVSALKLALQCGGSDAFSGISGNPLLAWITKEIIQFGGSAVLAETDELIGAEAYILEKVKDIETAEQFLKTIERFQAIAGWHGHSAEGNPTGGNLFRGLYNIYLKALGAATKKHPQVRLEGVLNYGERLPTAGYYFMDSPGNDLESIAGQVATGCNLIYFVTGNGSITNFPFVPTIKIVTTSDRYRLLANEMDINAGKFLDGESLAALGKQGFKLTQKVASGQLTAGEKAGHAQVQIWRNWQLTEKAETEVIYSVPNGQPLSISKPGQSLELPVDTWLSQIEKQRIGLVLPTSLCASAIAQMAANRLNTSEMRDDQRFTKFVTLYHTEGCGSSIQDEYVNTLIGHLTHPLVAKGLFLEHGCEVTHNDFWRQRLREKELDPNQYGWASIQRAGGIDHVLGNIETWFGTENSPSSQLENQRPRFTLGLMTDGEVDAETAVSLATFAQMITAVGGTLILPVNDPLCANQEFRQTCPLSPAITPTLPYATHPRHAGFHLMDNPSSQWLETQTGLGATGVHMILAIITKRPQQRHPFIPMLQASPEVALSNTILNDADIQLTGTTQQKTQQIVSEISAYLAKQSKNKYQPIINIGFQVTRGKLGVSL